MRHSFSTVFTLGTALLCQPVAAATTVFGNSDAQQCYESARFGSGTGNKEACDRALRDPTLSQRDRASTFVNRGILLNRGKRPDDAIDDFNSALKIDPSLGAAYLNRGNSMFFRKRIEAAQEDYTRAIRYGSRDLYAAYFNRGLANEVLGRIEDARSDYEKALELKPDFAAARTHLSELASGKGDKKPKEAAAGS